MKKYLLLTVLFLISSFLFADTLFIGYFGETFTHPGIEARYQFDKAMLFGKIGGGFRYYLHPRNHHGIQLFGELQYQFGIWIIKPYIGGQMSIPAEKIYSITTNSTVTETSYVDTDFMFGLHTGVILGDETNTDGIKHSIGLDLFARTPFNSTILPQLGFSYTLGFTMENLL